MTVTTAYNKKINKKDTPAVLSDYDYNYATPKIMWFAEYYKNNNEVNKGFIEKIIENTKGININSIMNNMHEPFLSKFKDAYDDYKIEINVKSAMFSL